MKIRQITAIILLISLFAVFSVSCSRNRSEKENDNTYDTLETTAETEEETTAEPVTTEEPCKHEWGEWILIRFPTKYEEGSELHYCMDCNAHQSRPVERLPDADYKFLLDVENILQFPNLPNGCEIVSLAIVLNYLGLSVDPVWLSDNYLDQGPYGKTNPFEAYVGNPKADGMGCYASCIVDTAKKYFSDTCSSLKAKNISGADDEELEAWLDKGVPVILWGTTYMNCDPLLFRSDNFDGKEVIWRAYSHCLVLVGYTANTYLFCDPLREGVTVYQKSDVRECRNYVYSQACVVYDPNRVDFSEDD